MKKIFKGLFAATIIAGGITLGTLNNTAADVAADIEFKGAQIRTIDDGYQGLRFIFQVTQAPIDATDIKYGVLIHDNTSSDASLDATSFTYENASNELGTNAQDLYNIEVEALSTYMGFDNSYALTLYGYNEEQYNHEIEVRGYLKYTKNEETHIIYDSDEINSRSISEIAEKVYDTNAEMRSNEFVSCIVDYGRNNYQAEANYDNRSITYSNDDYSYVIALPELNSDNGFTETENKKDPTCITDGYVELENEIYGTYEYFKAKTGHDFTEVEACDSTCQKHGYIVHYVCENCGKAFSSNSNIYNTGRAGEEAYELEFLDHNFVDGKCTECGCPDLIYSKVYNGYTVCLEAYSGDSTLKIPEDYRGAKVIKLIKPSKDGDTSDIKSLTIPDSVTQIEQGALSNISTLEYLYVPNCVIAGTGMGNFYVTDTLELGSLEMGISYVIKTKTYQQKLKNIIFKSGKTLNGSTFNNTSLVKLESLILPDELETIESNAFYQFSGCTEITLPSNVKEIKTSAFEESTIITLHCPATLEKIGMYAFRNSNLSTIDGLDNVTSIGQEAFKATQLKSISIPKANVGVDCFKGCSAMVSMTILLDSYPVGSIFQNEYSMNMFASDKYYLPMTLKNVTVYGDGAVPAHYLQDVYQLETVTFNGNITAIGNEAFKDCPSTLKVYLTKNCQGEVTLGNNVQSHDNLVFAYDHNTMTNYYCNHCNDYTFDATMYDFTFTGFTADYTATTVEEDIAFYMVSIRNSVDTTIYVPGVYNGKKVRVVTKIDDFHARNIYVGADVDVINMLALSTIVDTLKMNDDLYIHFNSDNYIQSGLYSYTDNEKAIVDRIYNISISYSIYFISSDYIFVNSYGYHTDENGFEAMYGDLLTVLQVYVQ